ncbi:hypothetical protein R3X27_22995 [Tropicimonas sp. TH_r6]|uniref:hypothetical protein n=1 Tax=Tropicimonas sp. TH_r6 TaxID=3082085 RepID=UPI0029529B33|nr:hypothetical protein [Tropicimonas sp. TH_r6]MDV7145564.1 hypothetical protein [Tropicimonas sp. TH_r6]
MTRLLLTRSMATACMLLCLSSLPGAAAELCLRVTVNDRPAGSETRIRLAASGQQARSGQPVAGAARFDSLAPGTWKLSLRHPQMKLYRTTLSVDGAVSVLLDCGHADEWSGCTVKSLPGGC